MFTSKTPISNQYSTVAITSEQESLSSLPRPGPVPVLSLPEEFASSTMPLPQSSPSPATLSEVAEALTAVQHCQRSAHALHASLHHAYIELAHILNANIADLHAVHLALEQTDLASALSIYADSTTLPPLPRTRSEYKMAKKHMAEASAAVLQITNDIQETAPDADVVYRCQLLTQLFQKSCRLVENAYSVAVILLTYTSSAASAIDYVMTYPDVCSDLSKSDINDRVLRYVREAATHLQALTAITEALSNGRSETKLALANVTEDLYTIDTGVCEVAALIDELTDNSRNALETQVRQREAEEAMQRAEEQMAEEQRRRDEEDARLSEEARQREEDRLREVQRQVEEEREMMDRIEREAVRETEKVKERERERERER